MSRVHERLTALEQRIATAEERFVVVFDNEPDPEPAYPGERLRIVRIVPWDWPGEEGGDGTACDGVAKHHDAA